MATITSMRWFRTTSSDRAPPLTSQMPHRPISPHTPDVNAYPGNHKVLVVWSALIQHDLGRHIQINDGGVVRKYREHLDGQRPRLTVLLVRQLDHERKQVLLYREGKHQQRVRVSDQGERDSVRWVSAGSPTNLIATPDQSNVGLYANLAPSTDVLIGYHIYRGNTSGTEGRSLS